MQEWSDVLLEPRHDQPDPGGQVLGKLQKFLEISLPRRPSHDQALDMRQLPLEERQPMNQIIVSLGRENMRHDPQH